VRKGALQEKLPCIVNGQLNELQEFVRGYIEPVSISGGKMCRNGRKIMAMVNEEGRLLNLPEHPFFYGRRGNVVLGKPSGDAFLGLNASEARDARHWLSRNARPA
jgi:hypothetical protein